MTEFTKTLLNARSLKAATKDLTLEQLEETLEKFSKIVEDRMMAEEAEVQAKETRQNELNETMEFLKAKGIDPAELVSLYQGETKKRAPRPAKYKYTEDGVEKTWTGQGRKPAVIQQALDNDGSLNDFAI